MSGEAPRRRVALYGGSFDPPHEAHVLAVMWLLTRGGMDEVRVVPAARHAFAKELSPLEARAEMLEAALGHLGPRVVIDRREAERPGPSYTIDTVRELRAELGELDLHLVMGTDAWADRERWHRWDELQELVTLILLGRDGVEPPADGAIAVELPAICSTEVRRRVASGEPATGLVPEDVLAIVEQRGLYR